MSDFDEMQVPGASLRFYPHGPAWDGEPAVALGALAFTDPEAGAALLREAVARAAGRPVLAPMDGDTWHAYRTVVESDGSPPFLMEPAAHPHVAEALALAGFALLLAMTPPRPCRTQFRGLWRHLHRRDARLAVGRRGHAARSLGHHRRPDLPDRGRHHSFRAAPHNGVTSGVVP